MTGERSVSCDPESVDGSVRTKHVVAGAVGRGRDGDGGRVLPPPSRWDARLAEERSVESLDRAVGTHDPVTPGRRVDRDARRGSAEGESLCGG